MDRRNPPDIISAYTERCVLGDPVEQVLKMAEYFIKKKERTHLYCRGFKHRQLSFGVTIR